MASSDPIRLLAEAVNQLRAATADPALKSLNAQDLAAVLQRVSAPAPQAPESSGAIPPRWQDKLIEQHIAPGSSVLDLGCGDGELLSRLMATKSVQGQGVELYDEAVFRCVERGVSVIQSDLDGGLSGFADQSFDYVILEETLQTLHRPVELLGEMLRVGRHGIISFPNFAYWRVRLDLTLRGRMPVTERLPHRWYDTPNIHLLSLQDFLDWTVPNQVNIVEAHALCDGQVRPLQPADNLYAEEVLFIVERVRF